jgi:cytochrome c oxidase subunit 2
LLLNYIQNKNDLPLPWQITFQDPASSQMEGIYDLYSDVMAFIVGILIFVAWMLLITLYYWGYFYYLKIFFYFTNDHITTFFSIKKKKSSISRYMFILLPSNWKFFNIHSLLEILWTTIPAFILIAIAIPSFSLLFSLDDPVLTTTSNCIMVIGAQWYWIYQFLSLDAQNDEFFFKFENYYQPEELLPSYYINSSFLEFFISEHIYINSSANFNFKNIYIESRMVDSDALLEGDLRLLTVDNWLLFYKKSSVTFLITSQDVLHSWAIPSLGIKVDACPGRTSSVTVFLKRTGLFYGQCSEICGVNHAFMPIVIEVVD